MEAPIPGLKPQADRHTHPAHVLLRRVLAARQLGPSSLRTSRPRQCAWTSRSATTKAVDMYMARFPYPLPASMQRLRHGSLIFNDRDHGNFFANVLDYMIASRSRGQWFSSWRTSKGVVGISRSDAVRRGRWWSLHRRCAKSRARLDLACLACRHVHVRAYPS